MSKSKNKSNSDSRDIPNQAKAQDSLLGLLARFFWALLGNLILFVLAAEIYRAHRMFSVIDLAYWGTAFLVITVRYVDIKYFKGVDYEGLPATMEHWRKYAKYYLLLSAGLWIVIHLVSFMTK